MPPPASPARQRVARWLCSLAVMVLLASLCSRAFLAEMPFRIQPVRNIAAAMVPVGPGGAMVDVDRSDLARIVFAIALLAATGLWALSGAVRGRLEVCCRPMGLGVVLFAAGSLGSVWAASDRPSAWLAWIDQVSLLSAGFVTIQLCRDGRAFRQVALSLAGLGIALGVKAVYEFGWEIPDRIAYFHAYGSAAAGLVAGEPGQAELASRILDNKVSGFFSLANLFGAAMCVLAAAAVGLAVAKIASARWQTRQGPALAKGQVAPEPIAAGLAAVGAALAVVALVLTRSRGAIGAFCVAAVAVAIVLRYRAQLARHWRKAVVAVAGLVVAGAAAVTAVGLARDSLGVKTLTIRWFYWTASAEVLAEYPVQGVGPGNFASAYLPVRRYQAEEAVKTPHNAVLHALVQYGWPVGLLWIALAGGMVVLAVRPGGEPPEPPAEARPTDRRGVLGVGLVAAGCVVAARSAQASPPEANISFFILDAVFPGLVLAVALTVAGWWPVRTDEPSRSGWLRVALAGGAGAFALHNMVTFGFWAPGVAMAFWIAAGAAAGGAARPGRVLRAGRWAVLAVAVVLLGAGVLVARPIVARHSAAADLAASLRYRQGPAARADAERLARADATDALAAMSAARVFAAMGDHARALDLAGQATQRDPKRSSAWRLRAEAAAALGRPAGTFYARAIELDPANARLRLAYAGWLWQAGQAELARQQVRTAREIDDALRAFDPDSDALLTPAELQG